MITIPTRKPARYAIALLTFFAILYLGQGAIYWVKLAHLDAEPIALTSLGETCDEVTCKASWTFVASRQFALIGHILRTHELVEAETGSSVVPASQVRGTAADSWATLRVYPLTPGARYTLKAEKYKSIKMGYFIGILPRASDHPGILSIPDIGPNVSTLSGLGLVFILGALLAAAALGGPTTGSSSNRPALKYYGIAACYFALAAFVSMGILDTLLPEGESRNKLLRISAAIGMTMPIMARFRTLWRMRSMVVAATSSLVIGALCLLLWPIIRGGAPWAWVMLSLTIAGVVSFYTLKLYGAAAIWSFGALDALKIFGLIEIPDYPPVYFVNAAILVALSHAIGRVGGYATLSLAGIAYRRFKREIVLRSIQDVFATSTADDSMARVIQLQKALPEISALTGAERTTITINLPLGRPITQTYDSRSQQIRVHDDGRIPGAVTLRCLVYGDEALFEEFSSFSRRLSLPHTPGLSNSGFFCAIPLRVNQSIVGALMLSGFSDLELRHKFASDKAASLAEDRETVKLVAERLAQSLSTLIVSDLDANAQMSRSLNLSIRHAIAASESDQDFLQRFAASLHQVSGLAVMIHERSEAQGLAVMQIGIPNDCWDELTSNPLNLSQATSGRFGPTVVAFGDGRPSYVKDIMEMVDKLHPRTQSLMERMGVMSVMAVPLKTMHRSFVITLMGARHDGPADPSLLAVVESTESLFVAAVEVMSQRTSVMALGRLASRLIGDEEVRSKILDAAKDTTLPTTVGSPRASFLLLFDLVGSSNLPEDTEQKARSYGTFYDAVNQDCQRALGGMIRKTIGDAVIVTWDGTGSNLTERPDLARDLKQVVAFADQTARQIGCRGTRAILHFGQYFLGLVGTQTFGQIDVIGTGIDEVCKMEGQMKHSRLAGEPLCLAISSKAAANLSLGILDDLESEGFRNLPQADDARMSIALGMTRPDLEVSCAS